MNLKDHIMPELSYYPKTSEQRNIQTLFVVLKQEIYLVFSVGH